MDFPEFAKKLFSVLSGGDSAEKFTKTLFDALVTDKGRSYIEERTLSTYKSYFYGKSSITALAKSINAFIDKNEFYDYLDELGEAVSENLCSEFVDVFPDATPENIKEKLAECFIEIVTNAAKATKKKPAKKQDTREQAERGPINNSSKALDIGEQFIKQHWNDVIIFEGKEVKPFETYLNKAKEFYSKKKTLLYAETLHPFYEMYICNDVIHHSRRKRLVGVDDEKPIENATISSFEPVYTHVIIEGTGGMGKSMFLTHLFLSFERDKDPNERTPILIQLRDYKKKMTLVQLIKSSVKKYESSITEEVIVDALNNGKLILLLDGLDEIPSGCRSNFNEELESFVKSYMQNTIIMTSRPISSFVSYTQFALFDIQELSKEQAKQLIEKLEFWDTIAKEKFIKDLDKRLYDTHHLFASNPLLLTIMLMTYSSFGDVPAKMHMFYSEAYRTMSRLHDASKGSYIRPLHTGLTPEEFSDLFAEFCARTYVKECIEFDERTFNEHMKAVLIKKKPPYNEIHPSAFLQDLTDNLCIMYHEGEKYYFIHRSFQEYFTALYFSSYYDNKLLKLGPFFEDKKTRFNGDIAFDMLYDMIPDKIERFVFLPFLEKIYSDDSGDSKEEYWNFLAKIYPFVFHDEGENLESFVNLPESFLYGRILTLKRMHLVFNPLDYYKWPSQINDWITAKHWCRVFSHFTDSINFEPYSGQEEIPRELLEETTLIETDYVPDEYADFFGVPQEVGVSVELCVEELRDNAADYPEIVSAMESSDFPLMKEYCLLKDYYKSLKAKALRIENSDSLFDD